MAEKKEPKKTGGAMPGGGGRLGPVTAISKVRAVEIIKTGNAPLDVMLRNMWFWDAHAETMRESIEKTMEDLREGASEELVDKLKGMLKGFLEAKQNAQGCAVDAAPYVHTKFQSVAVKTEKKSILEIRASLPATAASKKEDRSYRDGYDGDIIPIKRTGSD